MKTKGIYCSQRAGHFTVIVLLESRELIQKCKVEDRDSDNRSRVSKRIQFFGIFQVPRSLLLEFTVNSIRIE